jgi:uncharacterized protein with PQ loop repeat
MNALLILNRRRFLSKYGYNHGAATATPDSFQQYQNNPTALTSMKTQLIGLLQAVQYLKVPIIVCNTITIILEMLLGGT